MLSVCVGRFLYVIGIVEFKPILCWFYAQAKADNTSRAYILQASIDNSNTVGSHTAPEIDKREQLDVSQMTCLSSNLTFWAIGYIYIRLLVAYSRVDTFDAICRIARLRAGNVAASIDAAVISKKKYCSFELSQFCSVYRARHLPSGQVSLVLGKYKRKPSHYSTGTSTQA